MTTDDIPVQMQCDNHCMDLFVCRAMPGGRQGPCKTWVPPPGFCWTLAYSPALLIFSEALSTLPPTFYHDVVFIQTRQFCALHWAKSHFSVCQCSVTQNMSTMRFWSPLGSSSCSPNPLVGLGGDTPFRPTICSALGTFILAPHPNLLPASGGLGLATGLYCVNISDMFIILCKMFL